MILLLWKIAQGYVEGNDVSFFNNPRRGRLAVVQFYSARSALAVRKARAASLHIRNHGANLFNCIPAGLRNMTVGTVD